MAGLAERCSRRQKKSFHARRWNSWCCAQQRKRLDSIYRSRTPATRGGPHSGRGQDCGRPLLLPPRLGGRGRGRIPTALVPKNLLGLLLFLGIYFLVSGERAGYGKSWLIFLRRAFATSNPFFRVRSCH